MTVDSSRLISSEQIRYQLTDPSVAQTSANQLYWNPVAMAALDSTVVTPTLAVGYEELSATEIIVHFVEVGTDNSVRLRRSKNKRTGGCSFGPVITKVPFLRVVKGRQNRYPYRIDDLEDGTQRFVLLIDKPAVVPVPARALKAAATRKRKAAAAMGLAAGVMDKETEEES